MKIREVISNGPVQMQPSAVQSQTRINNMVKQMAASDQRMPPTETEQVLARMQFKAMKKQSDQRYAQLLQQQAMAAIQAQAPAKPKVGGREKR